MPPIYRDGIYAIGFLETDEKIELVERAPNRFRGGVESLRREIRRYIQNYFTPESGSDEGAGGRRYG